MELVSVTFEPLLAHESKSRTGYPAILLHSL